MGLYRGAGDYSINRKIGNDPPRAAAWGAEGVRATRLAPDRECPSGNESPVGCAAEVRVRENSAHLIHSGFKPYRN